MFGLGVAFVTYLWFDTCMNNTANPRITPTITIGAIVSIESDHVCRTARITSVRRAGQRLQYLAVTVEPYYDNVFENLDLFGTGELTTRDALMLKVNDDGTPYMPLGGLTIGIEDAR
jgi:hypothetical protein